MEIGQEIHLLGNWGILHFIENNGMAFGMEMGGKAGKFILSIFRIVAIFGIGWFLKSLVQKKANLGLILAVSAIMAGAVGNIIDSAFYGMIFSESYQSACNNISSRRWLFFISAWKGCRYVLFPGNKHILAGMVSIKAGESFVFFRPVFNIADSAITCGVLSIVLFQKKMFRDLS